MLDVPFIDPRRPRLEYSAALEPVCLFCQDRVVFLRKRERAHRHHALAPLQPFRDLHVVAVPNSHLYFLLMRLIVVIQNNHGIVAIRSQQGLRRNGDGMRNRLRHNLHLHVASRLQPLSRIRRLHPNLYRRAVGIERWAH